MRLNFFAVCLVAAWCSVTPAIAQPARLPPQMASAGITQSEWDGVVAEVRRQARRAGVAEAALLAAAERAGSNLAQAGQFNAATLRNAIVNRLQSQAQTISELQERLTVLARADDPEIARRLNEARAAINEGRLDDADHLLADAEKSDLAAVVIAEARAERARARVADAISERGRLEQLRGASASPNVRAAIATYEGALRQIDRALAPQDWTRTQFNLGIAYALLAQNGEDEARVLAVAALSAAALGYESLEDERGAARAQRLITALQASDGAR